MLYTRVTELTFKRYVKSAGRGERLRAFFLIWRVGLQIFIYSDESGVLDKKHNDFYVFGGVLFLSKEEKDIASRKYSSAEDVIRISEYLSPQKEVKASNISNKAKGKLYRSLNNVQKFGAVVNQKKLSDGVFVDPKTKQRYLDWLYKMAIKGKLKQLLQQGDINKDEVEQLHFYIDEHATATNGLYELKESLEHEFKYGTMNYSSNVFHPPIFTGLKVVSVDFCDSSKRTLVRAADIVSNHLYYQANQNDGHIPIKQNLYIYKHLIY